jgi:hypothetical protein
MLTNIFCFKNVNNHNPISKSKAKNCIVHQAGFHTTVIMICLRSLSTGGPLPAKIMDALPQLQRTFPRLVPPNENMVPAFQVSIVIIFKDCFPGDA